MEKKQKFNPQSLIAYIRSNFENPDMNVDYVSQRMGISLSYMSRSFKKYTGVSMGDYISACRIERAKLYLKNTSYSISDIVGLVGFGSATVFIRSFKKAEGITPKRYKILNKIHTGDIKMTNVKDKLIPYPVELSEKGGSVSLGMVSALKIHINSLGGSHFAAVEVLEKAFAQKGLCSIGDEGYEISLLINPDDTVFKNTKKEEAYFIDISMDLAQIISTDEAGLYYGALTLSKLLYTEQRELFLPLYTILDYPYYKTRGHFFECRYGSDFMTLDDWKRAVDYLSEMKINHITMGLYGCWNRQYDGEFAEYQYLPFKKYPQLKTPRDIKYYSAKSRSYVYKKGVLPVMYDEDYFGSLIAYAKEKFIKIVPLFNSLGHNTLIPRLFPEISALDENGNYTKTGFCTNNPKTYEIMFDIYDEIIDRYLTPNGVDSFEIGMDEIWPVMGVDKDKLYEERSPFCKCEKCKELSHAELMVDYIIRLCHHLKEKGMKNIYIYHDMLFENELLNEDFANRLKKEGLYDYIVIDWWSYLGYDGLFHKNADKVNSVMRSVGKPITGYFHWNMPNQMNENIYAMTETIMKHDFEGMVAYGSFEYCYDYNFKLFSQCSWNPVHELKNKDTLLRYANEAFPRTPDKAYEMLKKAQELTCGRNVREDNYLENFFEYYNNCYLNKDNEYPQDYPGKQFRAIRDEEEKYLPYLKKNIALFRELYDFFSSCEPGREADIWRLISATWLCLANEFYTIYSSVGDYHAERIDEHRLIDILSELIEKRDKTIALLEDVRIEANVYTAARNMTVVREFISDLILNIKADILKGIKPKADIFNFKEILSDTSKFLR